MERMALQFLGGGTAGSRLVDWERADKVECSDMTADHATLLQTFGQRLYQEYTCYTVFFISIEMCQIADVLIRKTRRLSVFQQGVFR